jgi:hypothetical protein
MLLGCKKPWPEELPPCCCCCWPWLSFCLDSARGIVISIGEYNKHHPNLHCWKRWNRSGPLDHGHWPVDGEACRKWGWVGDLVVPWLFSPFLHFFLLSCNKVWQVYCTNPGLSASSVEGFAFGGKVDPQIRPVFLGILWSEVGIHMW